MARRLFTVYISRSTDVFRNLALEEYFMRRHGAAASAHRKARRQRQGGGESGGESEVGAPRAPTRAACSSGAGVHPSAGDNDDDSEEAADDHTSALLLYRNTPAVVLGRNQNPWREADLWYATSAAGRSTSSSSSPPSSPWLQLARRRSGGGTVYHDLGNLNYCLVTPRRSFSKRHAAELVARAVQRAFNVTLAVNERNDLVYEGAGGEAVRAESIAAGSRHAAAMEKETEERGGDVCEGQRVRKVGGSAFRISAERAYHHGTLLLHADLAALEAAISPTQFDAHAAHHHHHHHHRDCHFRGRRRAERRRCLDNDNGVAAGAAVASTGRDSDARVWRMDAKGTPSVRARVCNLREEANGAMSFDAVAAAIAEQYCREEAAKRGVRLPVNDGGGGGGGEEEEMEAFIAREMAEMRDPRWIIGETPPCSVRLPLARNALDHHGGGDGGGWDIMLHASQKGARIDRVTFIEGGQHRDDDDAAAAAAAATHAACVASAPSAMLMNAVASALRGCTLDSDDIRAAFRHRSSALSPSSSSSSGPASSSLPSGTSSMAEIGAALAAAVPPILAHVERQARQPSARRDDLDRRDDVVAARATALRGASSVRSARALSAPHMCAHPPAQPCGLSAALTGARSA